MNGLDLFSGIGGISLALREWVRPVAYCENNRYCQSVLLQRMQSGDIDSAPIWNDVRTLRAEMLPEKIDIIYGGFPCQNISAAGEGAGIVAGDQSKLGTEIIRLTKEIRPAFVFIENVPQIRTRGLGRVASGLAGLGYDLRWTVVSAQEVGAPQIRKRWFMLAHAEGERSNTRGNVRIRSKKKFAEPFVGGGAFVGNPGGTRSQRTQLTQASWAALAEHRNSGPRDWPSWLPKPALHRGDNGLSNRVDRTHALGNSVVPDQARAAFLKLLGSDDI